MRETGVRSSSDLNLEIKITKQNQNNAAHLDLLLGCLKNEIVMSIRNEHFSFLGWNSSKLHKTFRISFERAIGIMYSNSTLSKHHLNIPCTKRLPLPVIFFTQEWLPT